MPFNLFLNFSAADPQKQPLHTLCNLQILHMDENTVIQNIEITNTMEEVMAWIYHLTNLRLKERFWSIFLELCQFCIKICWVCDWNILPQEYDGKWHYIKTTTKIKFIFCSEKTFCAFFNYSSGQIEINVQSASRCLSRWVMILLPLWESTKELS